MSARNWDHNDSFAQYLGSHALVSVGIMEVLSRICPDSIKLESRVTLVERKENGLVQITCSNGDTVEADQVIITLMIVNN